MAGKKIPKNIKFEDALQELEKQVEQLESGKLSLEESLEVYKYGIELSKVCMTKLEDVKKEVEKIVEADNSYTTEQFQDMEAQE